MLVPKWPKAGQGIIASMFNADAVVIKKPLKGMSALRFFGSQLITQARYLSSWSFPQLHETWRIRGRSDPIKMQPDGRLLLSRLRREYQVVDIANGEVVGACPVAQQGTRDIGNYALSACGRFIIVGELDAIRVREVGTGHVVWERKLERASLSGLWQVRNGTQWAFHVNATGGQPEDRPPPYLELWDWPFGSHPRSVREWDLSHGCTVSDTGLIALPGFRSKPISIFDLESGRMVREFRGPANNNAWGYVHWLPGNQLALAWEGILFIASIKELFLREFWLPTYSIYSVAATDDFLALSYHDGFVLVPLDRLPASEISIEISPPWQDPPEPEHDNTDHSFVTRMPASYRTLASQTAEGLRNELQEFERPAWIPQVCFRLGELTSSKLGGTPWISEAEEWPCCGVCSRPMELFLQLNAEELPDEMAFRFSGLLQVFLCVTNPSCSDPCALGYEGFSKASLLRLCNPVGPPRYRRPPFEDAFIEGVIESWQPRVDLPSSQELKALGIEASDDQWILISDQSEQFTEEGDKLGGWPMWQHNLDYIACPRCKRRMDVIFQIDSSDTLPHDFMDGGTAWVSQCGEHRDVLALNWSF